MSLRANKRYHIITIGCQMNKADSERLAAFLESQDYREAARAKAADLLLINTCGVRQAAEDRVYGLATSVKRENPAGKIVITGCLSQREDVKKRLAGCADLFLPINEMFRLPELLAGEKLKPYFSLDAVRKRQGEKYLTITPKLSTRFSAYVPIGNGCDNFCAYCVVPYVRGREVYRPAEDIIKEVEALIKTGYKEIYLLAQNVNSYRDRDYDFPRLLTTLSRFPGRFWLRFFSSHPKDMNDKLIKALAASPKICRHLHLPVQAGDDAVLKAMNRHYTISHYQSLIKKARRAKPGLAVTTDVIVGFPGETKKQFLATAKLFREVKFDLAYIAPYSPRPQTAAYRLKDDVDREEKRRRFKVLTDILKKTALANNRKYLGQTVTVLVEGKNRAGKYYGRTDSYKTVLFTAENFRRKKKSLIGEFAEIEIKTAYDFGLAGVLK